MALARLHLGDLALVQHDAAHELAVERDHVPRERVAAHLLGRADEPAAGVLHKRERLGQQLVERLALGKTFLELRSLLRVVLRREVLRLVFLFNLFYLRHDWRDLLEVALVLGAENHL